MLTLNRRAKNADVATREFEPWDPFRIMREMTGWDPLQEVGTTSTQRHVYSPAFEVKEAGDAYVFKADLPGVAESDLDISLTGNRLTIAGKREQEKSDANERYFSYERSFGSFSRSFTLPDGIDGEHVKAQLTSGVLTLVVPKKPEVQPRRIPVGSQPKS